MSVYHDTELINKTFNWKLTKKKINIRDHEHYEQLQPGFMNMGLPFRKSQELHQINTLQRHLLCY